MNIVKDLNLLEDGQTLTLEKDAVYSVWQGDCALRKGYYFSNMASREENPYGEHRAALYLKGKKNITIDGNGATILIHGVVTPFLFDGCQGVTVKNLTIDYARPTMSEFLIEKKEENGYILHIPEEFLFEIDGNRLVWVGEKDRDGNCLWSYPYKGDDVLSMYYDPKNGQMKMMKRWGDDIRPSVPDFACIKRIDHTHVRVELKNETDFLPLGCTVQTRKIVRNEAGACFWYCKDIRLEGVQIFAMHGFGLLSQYCENVTYQKVTCVPKTGRTVASNADFFHYSGCKGNILIEGCNLSAGHDDFINVHGTHLRVVDCDETGKTLRLRFIHPQSWGFEAFRAGDKIELVEWDTLLPYAQAEVACVERIDDTDVSLTLDKAMSVKTVGKDVVENATWTASLTVRNNEFGGTGARGILCTTRQPILIENNTFTNVNGGVLVVEDDCNFWFESGYTRQIVFRNNYIKGCAYGFEGEGCPLIQITPQVLSKITDKPVHGSLILENNTFKKGDAPEISLQFEYIERVLLQGNSFDAEYRVAQKCVGAFVENK